MVARFDAWLESRPPRPEPDGGERADSHGLAAVWPAYFASPEERTPCPSWRPQDAHDGIWASLKDSNPTLVEELGDIEVPVGFLAGACSPLPPDVASAPTAAAMP